MSNHPSPTDILLRPATPADARFIALILMEALSRDAFDAAGELKAELQPTLERIVPAVLRDDTLYSYRHATLATLADGTPIAATIAYEGSRYRELQRTTFELLSDLLDFDPSEMDPEARPGDHYLDSLATLPQYRLRGAGQLLMKHWIAKAQAEGLIPTLAVYPTNEKAIALYRKMGFRDDGPLFIFGEDYRRYCIS